SAPAAGPVARGRKPRTAVRRTGGRCGSSWQEVVCGRVVVHAALQLRRRDEIEVVAVVAEDSTAQAAPVVGSGRAKALEFDLELDRVVHLAAGVAQVAAGHQPGGHAAAFPL